MEKDHLTNLLNQIDEEYRLVKKLDQDIETFKVELCALKAKLK